MEPDSKKKRGRPRSVAGEVAAQLPAALLPEGCRRSKVNYAYRLRALRPVVHRMPDGDRADLLGCTVGDIRKGAARFPRGWDTTAEEIGRFLHAIDADDDTEDKYLRVALKARRDGLSWRDIRSHFRRLRLGDRHGNSMSLTRELAVTIDGYRSRFPDTADEVIQAAVESLLSIVTTTAAEAP